MSRLSTFQQNNLFVGTQLAAELPCLYPERRAFVVIGAYIQTSQGVLKPSKALNADRSDIRFWIRKYEIEKSSLEKDLDITDDNLKREEDRSKDGLLSIPSSLISSQMACTIFSWTFLSPLTTIQTLFQSIFELQLRKEGMSSPV
jgi:hypothetical protein